MGWIERLPPFLLFKMGGLRGAALTYPRFFEKTRINFKKGNSWNLCESVYHVFGYGLLVQCHSQRDKCAVPA